MERNDQFREKNYWERRFENEQTYEWLADYDKISHLIKPYLKSQSSKILILGCGNSRLGFDIYKDGFINITQLDYCPQLIERSEKESEAQYPLMRWVCMDIRHMHLLETQSFDVVIEKATIDSLLVSEKDPWRLSESISCELKSVLSHISRILKKGGAFLSISFTQPHFRAPVYVNKCYDWSMLVNTFGDHFHYFFYVMIKGGELDSSQLQRYLCGAKRDIEENTTQLEFSYDDSFLMNIDAPV